MKRIFCVAVLIGLTTALHAGQYNWEWGEGRFRNDALETLGAYTQIANLEIYFTFHPYWNDSTGNLISLKQRNGTGTTSNLLTIGLSANNPKTMLFTFGDNEPLVGTVAAERVTEKTWFNGIGVVFTQEQGNVFQGLTVDYQNDGVSFGVDKWNDSSLSLDFNGKSFDLVEEVEELFTGITITIEGTPVPEPGVMALLALGVAGLALRRKVA